jgi:hypothetical protein
MLQYPLEEFYMSAPTGQALKPTVDMPVHLDSPSVPKRWFVNEHYGLWLFLDTHNTLVVAEFDDTTVTFHMPDRPGVVLPVPIEDFHSGYFVAE